MASYLQGVTDFIPEVQPFAPDFNFYSGSLQMSQNKYDAAKQQISSVYGSLLNAPLTRSSNIEAREKFFKTIDNDIKKVSGLDLSLQQNVTAASGLFNQMLDNKNIAGDMVWTKQFQGQVGKGKALKGCANAEKCGGSWWQGGDQLMQYAQRDYQNATDEEARNMGVPDYVAYQDITKKAMALAKEADLNVKMDQKSGGYIITTQNGPLVMQSLADLFQGSLSKDPMIKEYYNAQAKLQRRNYMTTNAEKHGSEEAAEQAYITEKTEAIESLYKSMGQNLESNIEHEGKKAEQLEEKKAEATPDRAKSLDEALGRVRNRQAALAESNNVATENNDQIALAKKTNNYTGYQMDAAIAGINLSTDINKNAEILAYKDYEQTMKEDPYSMEAVKQSNRLSLADRKFEYDMKKIEYKSKLDAYYDGGGGGSGGKGGLGNGLGNDPVNEQVAGSTENTLASENNKYGQGDMLWGSEYEKDLESGYNLFTDDRRELKKDLSADQRVLSNQIVETTRRAADGGDAQAQEDYINLFNQHVSATGKGTKLNSTNINQAYKQARSSGIDITNMESGTLASYYDNVMEGYINPSKNSNKDTRSYLSPIWEGGQELISNINTSNQYLGEMNKFFAQDANTSFSKALAKGDITDAMYKSLVAYIDPETGEARGKADYLAAGGIADLYREDKRLTTAQKYNSDTGKIEDSYWEGTKNVASAGIDAVGTTALGLAELAKDSFLTAVGSGWLWGDGQDFFDIGFDLDDSGDVANWGGANETDDWRNDDSKKGAPGVVDEMKRVFSKYAEPRGAQGWQGLKGTGNKAAQGSTFQQVDVANVRDLGVQGMKSVLSDALPDASAIFNFGGFKESATDDDKSARMIMMNLLQDSHAQIKGEKRFRGQMTFTPIANSNGEQYGMNVKFNQQYLNQYKGTEAYPGSVSEESWTTLMNDGITVYQNKANSNNVLLQGTQKSSAEISMDWTGSIPYEAYPRYAKNVKTSKSQNGYLTTGEWMTGLDANGLPMYEPYSIPHQASQNLNDIIKEVDKTILESVQMNRQIEQQWVTNNKK